jgi:hypothetical protein
MKMLSFDQIGSVGLRCSVRKSRDRCCVGKIRAQATTDIAQANVHHQRVTQEQENPIAVESKIPGLLAGDRTARMTAESKVSERDTVDRVVLASSLSQDQSLALGSFRSMAVGHSRVRLTTGSSADNASYWDE